MSLGRIFLGARRVVQDEKTYLGALVVLLISLPFSYQPLIRLASVQGATYDFSIIYAAMGIFLLVSLPILWKHKAALLKRRVNQLLLLFVAWNLTSVLWSDNPTRGLVVSLLLLALSGVVLSLQAQAPLVKRSRRLLINVVVITTVVVSVFSLWQLWGEALGVSSDWTLLPAAYQSQVFGFARVTAFAAEPEFLGNLLLAPFALFLHMALGARNTKSRYGLSRSAVLALLALVTVVIFLTLSRGALLALAVLFIGLCVLHVRARAWRLLAASTATLLLSFCIGIALFTAAAAVNHAYSISGREALGRLVNQLSLGVIELPAEAPQQSSQPTRSAQHGPKPTSGYVEVSTTSRLEMSQEALRLATSTPQRALFGVGGGSYGATLHAIDPRHSPSSIVNNHYLEVFVELGLVGLALFLGFIGMGIGALVRTRQWLFLPLVVALLFQWLFFSGYPNALHLWVVFGVALAFALANGKIGKKMKNDV